MAIRRRDQSRGAVPLRLLASAKLAAHLRLSYRSSHLGDTARETLLLPLMASGCLSQSVQNRTWPKKCRKKTLVEIKQWEAQHGLGAAWGTEENRAAVLVFDTGSLNKGRIFATGIRNCVGLTIQPATGQLWCTTNERDGLGDDLVPDYSTRVKEGGYYGWPWYYLGNHEDPRHAGSVPILRARRSYRTCSTRHTPLRLISLSTLQARALPRSQRNMWGMDSRRCTGLGIAIPYGTQDRPRTHERQ